jgi:hypothetical protein
LAKSLRIQSSCNKFASVAIAFALCSISGGSALWAQNGHRACPVVINQVNLTYSHEGNPSVPRLEIRFTNAGPQPIARVVFQLALLDGSGYSHEYPDDLTSNAELEPRKEKVSNWTLQPQSIDIHRAGETVVVKKVSFAEGNPWSDDGSESCKFVVDFHAR